MLDSSGSWTRNIVQKTFLSKEKRKLCYQIQINFLIENKSIVDGKEIIGFRATFNLDNLTFLPCQIDKVACKEHRDVVREDQAEFEDYAYKIQELMKIEREDK